MSGMQATVYGRLGNPAKDIKTRTGNPMAIGSIAVDTSHEKNPDSTTWFSLICFGRNAELLKVCGKGEMISATGRIQAQKWECDGKTIEKLQLVVDTLHSARTIRARPKPKPVGNTWTQLAG